MRKREKKQMQVSAGSMADVAFLLLVFFLITTTIAQEKGIKMILPPKQDDRKQTKIIDRNVLSVLVNSRNQILLEGNPAKLNQLKTWVKTFVSNPERSPDLATSPQEAIVSIKAARGTSYTTYLQILGNIKKAYHELRAKDIGISLEDYLKFDEQKASKTLIQKYERSKTKYPIRISEAEPDAF